MGPLLAVGMRAGHGPPEPGSTPGCLGLKAGGWGEGSLQNQPRALACACEFFRRPAFLFPGLGMTLICTGLGSEGGGFLSHPVTHRLSDVGPQFPPLCNRILAAGSSVRMVDAPPQPHSVP